MWFLFQIAIMTLIIGSNGAYHWAGDNSGFAVPLLAAFAASWLSVWLNDLFQMDASQAPITPANVIQNGCNVGTNTAINVNATDNTATKTAASESSKPNGRQRIGANRHQRARGVSLNDGRGVVLRSRA